MYNTILLLSRHLSFASLISFHLTPISCNDFSPVVKYYKKFYSLVSLFSKATFETVSLSSVTSSVTKRSVIFCNFFDTFLICRIGTRYILPWYIRRWVHAWHVLEILIFLFQEGISNRFRCVKTHSAMLLEESTIPATKSWCTSFTFQQLLGSGRLIWMC